MIRFANFSMMMMASGSKAWRRLRSAAAEVGGNSGSPRGSPLAEESPGPQMTVLGNSTAAYSNLARVTRVQSLEPAKQDARCSLNFLSLLPLKELCYRSLNSYKCKCQGSTRLSPMVHEVVSNGPRVHRSSEVGNTERNRQRLRAPRS